MRVTERKKNPGNLVFGLDIGTRSVVGTVGYRTGETFHVVAQCERQHETRSMLDGQIHDIEKVGHTINDVKSDLEAIIGKQLHEVCIAAAGRVLKTINSSATLEFPEETTIDAEHVYTLEMLGVEKAYEDFQAANNTDLKFYCVGYTVVKYYLNGYAITTLERHKATSISVDLIATFLPDDVVDGLYKAVEIADLEVANLTLEPIAAMTAAIPDMYRMLNIALVDVGAGTSDISVTKDGSIIAYGMIPKAGDELTEAIASALLLDFNEAEHVKIDSGKKAPIKFTDIMGLEHKIEPKEVHKIAEGVIADITKDVSDKIKELNGDRPVSAVFVVGGGGKITGFTDALAKEMGIMAERVALRGEEVLKEVDYQFSGAVLDSTYVTPVGICLNFYDQKNNFIFVTFNDKRIKLYDNGHLTIADAAMQAGFPNEGLFPKRGPELNFIVNGKPHMIRGEVGEGACIKLNGKEVSLTASIVAGDRITVDESTEGEAAAATIGSLLEYGSTISVIVNDKKVELPKFAEVNGNLQSEFYDIRSGDDIKMLNYYTVSQIIEFMDVLLNPEMNIYVNNKKADRDTKCYDNFSVIWTMEELTLSDVSEEEAESAKASVNQKVKKKKIENYEDAVEAESLENSEYADDGTLDEEYIEYKQQKEEERLREEAKNYKTVTVFVNGDPVMMNNKSEYVFVDIFDYIDFDLKNRPAGKGIVTMLNGHKAIFSEPLNEGDFLDISWQ
ncbi:MAG: rod shape-determining protein [Lachnospiraceae bacterium]|nr:rod shape-determining protein [Lachnospiraceae bacterium]